MTMTSENHEAGELEPVGKVSVPFDQLPVLTFPIGLTLIGYGVGDWLGAGIALTGWSLLMFVLQAWGGSNV